MSIYHELLGVSAPTVIGKIELPKHISKNPCTCDDCGDIVNDSCGDPRVCITTHYNDDSKEFRYVCQYCADEQFGDHSPHSIFG
jgi:hypothetical protein